MFGLFGRDLFAMERVDLVFRRRRLIFEDVDLLDGWFGDGFGGDGGGGWMGGVVLLLMVFGG